MHVLLVAVGSHGDVHPFVAMGLALKERGHRVTLITNPHFADLAARAGLDFLPLGTEQMFVEATENPLLWSPLRGFQIVVEMSSRMMEPLYELILDRYVPGETVVAAPVTAFGARVAQEAKGVPLVTVHLQPAVFRSALEPPVLPYYPLIRRLPVWGRRVMFRLLDATVVDRLFGPRINGFRATLGLPKVSRFMNWWHSPTAVLGLFPAWFAPPQADWPPHVTLAGFPLFDESAHREIDPEVQQFLDAGSLPVVFTAGSAMKHGAEFFQAAVEATALLGRRAILLARFPEQIPQALPANVRHFTSVPFGRLLPQAAALVHHGGIGTTAQALAAGLPQLVMPMAHDQPDNAARLERLGVGRSLAPSKFRGPAVARELHALLDDPAIPERAQRLAARLNASQAIDQACQVLELALTPQKPSRSGSADLSTTKDDPPDRIQL